MLNVLVTKNDSNMEVMTFLSCCQVGLISLLQDISVQVLSLKPKQPFGQKLLQGTHVFPLIRHFI